MACRDRDGVNETEGERVARADLAAAQVRADGLARMLCGLCGRLEGAGVPSLTTPLLAADPELAVWWDSHKSDDHARRREELRKAVAARLTPEERAAVGL